MVQKRTIYIMACLFLCNPYLCAQQAPIAVPPPAPAAMAPTMAAPAPGPAPAPIIAPPPPPQTQPVAPASYQTTITQIKDKLKTVDTFKNTLKELVSQADDIAKKCKTVIKESRLKRIEIRKTADEKAAAILYADIEKNAQTIKTLESDLDAKTKECNDISQKIKTSIGDVNTLIKQLEAQGVTFKEIQVQKEEKEDAAKELANATEDKKQSVQEPEKDAVKVNELQPQESYAGYVWRKTQGAFVSIGRFFYTTWIHTKDYFFSPSPAALPAPGVPVIAPASTPAKQTTVQPGTPPAPMPTPSQTPVTPAQPTPNSPQPEQTPQDTLPPESMPIASAGVPAEASDIDGDIQRIESRYQALNKDLENCERETNAVQKTLASNESVYEEISDYQSLKDSIKKATNKAVDVTIDAAEKTGRFAKRIYREKVKPFAQHVAQKVKAQFADTETPKEQHEHIEKPIAAPQMPIQ